MDGIWEVWMILLLCGWNILTNFYNLLVLWMSDWLCSESIWCKGTSSQAHAESNINFWRWHMGFVEVPTNRKVTYGILLKPWLNLCQTSLSPTIIEQKEVKYTLPPSLHSSFVFFFFPLSRLKEGSDLMRMTKYYVVFFQSLPSFLLAFLESSIDICLSFKSLVGSSKFWLHVPRKNTYACKRRWKYRSGRTIPSFLSRTIHLIYDNPCVRTICHKNDSSLKIDFSNQEENFLELESTKSYWKVMQEECHNRATSFFQTSDSDPNVKSLGLNFCSRPIRALDFGVSLVKDQTPA